MDEKRAMLRHAVATVAYRGGKALRGAPEGFGAFRAGPGTRAPVEVLAHVGDLFDWALSMAEGAERWVEATPLPWEREAERFFGALARFDARLADDRPLACPVERLFQGPVADALTHVGQIAMLRRMGGAPVRGENYARARIAAGNVGPDQPAPVREFD